MAILSGNDDLLEKAKLDKKLAVLESEMPLRTAAAIYKVWELRKDLENGKSGEDGAEALCRIRYSSRCLVQRTNWLNWTNHKIIRIL